MAELTGLKSVPPIIITPKMSAVIILVFKLYILLLFVNLLF